MQLVSVVVPPKLLYRPPPPTGGGVAADDAVGQRDRAAEVVVQAAALSPELPLTVQSSSVSMPWLMTPATAIVARVVADGAAGQRDRAASDVQSAATETGRRSCR